MPLPCLLWAKIKEGLFELDKIIKMMETRKKMEVPMKMEVSSRQKQKEPQYRTEGQGTA